MLLRIIGTDLPGRGCGDHTNVHVGIQRKREPDQVVSADDERAVFTTEITVVDRNGTPDFRGPCVQGRPGDRFVYLTWGDVDSSGDTNDDTASFAMFRRAKLMLAAVDPETVRSADQPGRALEARLTLTDACGLPRCAALRPPEITWTVAPA